MEAGTINNKEHTTPAVKQKQTIQGSWSGLT